MCLTCFTKAWHYSRLTVAANEHETVAALLCFFFCGGGGDGIVVSKVAQIVDGKIEISGNS